MLGIALKTLAHLLLINLIYLRYFYYILTSKVSWLYLDPLHSSHLHKISERKCISTFFTPSPLQASQRPPLVLNENLPAL